MSTPMTNQSRAILSAMDEAKVQVIITLLEHQNPSDTKEQLREKCLELKDILALSEYFIDQYLLD